MEVIATGKLTTYAGSSRYQIIIDRLELAGEGALLKLLEDRRKKLAAEGLFDLDRKRPLPFLPEVIGVVTSPTRRGDPRHPAPAGRPLPAPCAGLAGGGAGREGGGAKWPPRSPASTACPSRAARCRGPTC